MLAVMHNDEIWDIETAKSYDTPGTGMFSPEVLGPTVDRLAELAGDGRALEFFTPAHKIQEQTFRAPLLRRQRGG